MFDTVVRNSNLGYHMIDKYRKQRGYVNLIPKEIIKTSAKYWAKILDVLDERGIVQQKFIDEFIEDANIKAEDISWECLYDLCENKL